MSSSCSMTVGIQPMFASTSRNLSRRKRCGTPEKTSSATTGMVCAPAGECDARVEHLRPDAVGVQVGQAGLRVEASGTDVLVAEAFGLELRVRKAGGGRETERTEPLAVVEAPDVAALGPQHFGSAG